MYLKNIKNLMMELMLKPLKTFLLCHFSYNNKYKFGNEVNNNKTGHRETYIKLEILLTMIDSF